MQVRWTVRDTERNVTASGTFRVLTVAEISKKLVEAMETDPHVDGVNWAAITVEVER